MLFPGGRWRYFLSCIGSRALKAAVFTWPPRLGVKRFDVSEPDSYTTKNDSNSWALKCHPLLLGDALASSPLPSLSRTFASVPLKPSTPPPPSPWLPKSKRRPSSPSLPPPPTSSPVKDPKPTKPTAKHPKAKDLKAKRPKAKIPSSKYSLAKKRLRGSDYVMSTFIEYTKLRTYPYKNLSKPDQNVVERFFNSEPFHAHGWDIYLHKTPTRDFLLIPGLQVDPFFQTIADETGLADFTNFSTERLAFDFRGSREVPVLLGAIKSKAELDRMKEERGIGSTSQGRRPKKNKGKGLEAQGTWDAQVQAARHYLGLEDGTADAGTEVQKVLPVFVSVDVESYEFNHNVITEIGITTLDTADLPSGPSPGGKPRSDAIIDLIRPRHIRIHENRYMRNGTYVDDAADNFVFGKSEFVLLKDIPRTLSDAFYFLDAGGNRRRIVLVGHDVKSDISYLRVAGYNVTSIDDLEIIDTTCMWKAVMNDRQSKGLGGVLLGLELDFRHLHNAGNDAAYTLQALIKLAEKGLPKVEGQEQKPRQPNNFRPVFPRAEDVIVGFVEAVVPSGEQPLPPPAARRGSSSEGSALSVGWD